MRQAPPNQVRLSAPNLIRAAGEGRPVASRDLREPDSSVSGCPAQGLESGSACASPPPDASSTAESGSVPTGSACASPAMRMRQAPPNQVRVWCSEPDSRHQRQSLGRLTQSARTRFERFRSLSANSKVHFESSSSFARSLRGRSSFELRAPTRAVRKSKLARHVVATTSRCASSHTSLSKTADDGGRLACFD